MNSSTIILFGTLLFKAIAIQSSSSSASFSQSISSDSRLRGNLRPEQRHIILHDVNCILFRKDIRYLSTNSTDSQASLVLTDKKWACEYENISVNDVVSSTTVELEEINSTFVENHGAKSGFSALVASEARVESADGKKIMIFPSTASVKILDRPHLGSNVRRQKKKDGRNLAASSGNLKTLVVRVIAKNGIEPTARINQLRSDVFDDQVCLKSQYKACSYGQLIIEPFRGSTLTGRNIDGGVVNVKINVNPVDGNRNDFEDEAKRKAAEIYGDLSSQFDLVLFCIPPGTGDWLAFAYINRFDSYYNDKWASSVSTQVHEVGHNLGLAHSGEGSETYGDQSGMMGFSYNVDDAPLMCFNPAKNYQLGWYKQQQDFVNPLTEILARANPRDYVLNGVSDFEFGRNGSENKLIALRLKQQNSREDYYVGFNRRAGMNSGTVEDANHIIIVKKTSGPIEYGQSWKVSTLSRTEDAYTIKNFDRSSFDVTVKLISVIGKDATVRVSTTNSASCHEVSDSTNLHYKKNKNRDCEWVSKRKFRRCAKTWMNELLSEWCPLTCGSCSERKANSLESLVGKDYSNVNSFCSDAQNVSYQNSFTKNCEWVGQEEGKKGERCANEWLGKTLSSLCPNTCGSC